MCGQVMPLPSPNSLDIERARWEQPHGKFCGCCKNINDWANDAGWFWVNEEALCEKCYRASGFQTAER